MGSGGSPSLGAVSAPAEMPALLFTMSGALGIPSQWEALLTLTGPQPVRPTG